MATNTRIMILQVEIEVPAETGEIEVGLAINAALEEPPCDWGNWVVGAARIVAVTRSIREDDDIRVDDC